MTDQNMPADKVEKIVASMREAMRRDDPYYSDGEFLEDMSGYIRDLEALLPTPPLPTLEDMTPVARRECQWMQCEVRGERRIITLVLDDSDENYVVMLDSSGYISHCPFEWVTPLPDLPRMTWPGTEKDEDANTVKAGDVIDSADDPRISALPVGTILLDRDGEAATKRTHSWTGAGYEPIESEGDEYGPWTVLHIGQEDDQ